MKLLKELTQINGVSGNESAICNYIRQKAERFCDEVYTDALGNLIAHKKGTGNKIMLSAHMDEIGIIVTHIDKNGFIRFSNVGGLNTSELVSKRVCFDNGVVGVIGCEDNSSDSKIKLSMLYIDVGGQASKIKIGDVASFCGDFIHNETTVISKAIDNRVGAYILLKAMEIDSDKDVYYVFSCQEEVGLRGAKTAAFSIKPDYAIAVDVTDTGDTPSTETMEVSMGKGAAIKVMDRSILCDAYIRSVMIDCAKENNIPYQMEIMTDGGTDAGAIQLSRGGVKTGGISIPTRYIHSPSEMASVDDIKACINLLVATVEKL